MANFQVRFRIRLSRCLIALAYDILIVLLILGTCEQGIAVDAVDTSLFGSETELTGYA